jgi:hypothetical protein
VVRAMASTGQRANRQAFGQQVFSMWSAPCPVLGGGQRDTQFDM